MAYWILSILPLLPWDDSETRQSAIISINSQAVFSLFESQFVLLFLSAFVDWTQGADSDRQPSLGRSDSCGFDEAQDAEEFAAVEEMRHMNMYSQNWENNTGWIELYFF